MKRRRSSIERRSVNVKEAFILMIIALCPVICSADFQTSDVWDHVQILRLVQPWLTPENDTRCYGVLGCLTIDNDVRTEYNMISNLLPLRREIINTRFFLYTSLNTEKGDILEVAKPRSVKRSKFDSQRPTKFIIHGYTESLRKKWVTEMKNELLKHDNYNVIVVDWEGGSNNLYPQVAANTRLVGLEIVHLIKHLKAKHGLDERKVHLIGNSLGAHVAGFVGYKLDGSIGRITGLDPAQMYFEKIPHSYHLDPTDAEFVDVIHTETRILGLPEFSLKFRVGIHHSCGHLDFYPNGGHTQPGCEDTDVIHPMQLKRALSCSHARSRELFTESINSKCPYVAHECADYETFLRGECFTCGLKDVPGCAIMGYHADTSPALAQVKNTGRNASALRGLKFFMATGSEKPYCRYNCRFALIFPNPSVFDDHFKISMNVIWNGVNETKRKIDLERSQNLHVRHGHNFCMMNFVVTFGAEEIGDLGEITRVSLFKDSMGMFSWVSDNVVCPAIGEIPMFCQTNKIRVAYIVHDILELPEQRKNKIHFFGQQLCPMSEENYAEISGGTSALFDTC